MMKSQSRFDSQTLGILLKLFLADKLTLEFQQLSLLPTDNPEVRYETFNGHLLTT